MGLTTVTVTGKWRLPDATVPAGTVRFEPSTAFQNTGDDTFVVNSVEATLDASGAISVALYATDDADTSPANAQYTVTERIAGATRIYNVEIPNANSTVDLADLAPTTAQTSVSYALTSHGHDIDGGSL